MQITSPDKSYMFDHGSMVLSCQGHSAVLTFDFGTRSFNQKFPGTMVEIEFRKDGYNMKRLSRYAKL
ncbi:hypothetical protein TWF225_006973 [Orbilia oligospora]|nr:hypothetical protein TWF225_006973 [Orbilia oligospora]KAF3242704.1 hypothetical protein TWF128_010440 [Orbilia oligospora]KAF3264181.1 hypothetical protein TWF217_003333 [Orbilia oligospora]KAF3296067.1 hypothetical protein TWF132_011536 [Orbilia oligospora]